MNLTGKKVIVTGGSGGMGAAIVKVLPSFGATVTSFDLNSDPGIEIATQADASGPGSATFRSLDLRDRAAVFAAFEEATEKMGGLDTLVHTAGVHKASEPLDVTDDLYDLIMDVNVRGTVISNQAAFEPLKRNGGGSIINFGSVSGLRPEPGSLIYSASKGAVHSWTRSLAQAWGKHAIRVNAVLPIIATPMYHAARAAMTEEQVKATFGHDESQIALGNAWGDAETDLAPVIAFLIDTSSRFITGQLLPVDGGLASVR